MGRDFAIGDQARIGGATDADVRLQVEGVSREHARIWKDGDDYWIEDRESTNGTFVNGERVRRLRLHHLDVVTFGRDLDMVFMERKARSVSRFREGVRGARIEWLDGPEEGETVELQRGETSIGRAPACTLIVSDARISKLHARIVRERDIVTVEDLGSTNGTWIGGREITAVRELADGDRVSLGGVELRVHLDIDADATQIRDAAVTDTAYGSTGFDQEWRTKLVWSNEELEELEQIRRSLREPEEPDEQGEAEEEAPAGNGEEAAPAAEEEAADAARSETSLGMDPPDDIKARTISVGKSAHERAPRSWALRSADGAIQLGPGRLLVGRDPAADVRVDQPGVSRQHARLQVDEEGLWVEDLDSVNGTEVNGERIEERTRLAAGDEVAFAAEAFQVEETHES